MVCRLHHRGKRAVKATYQQSYLRAPRGRPFGDFASRGILLGLRSACVTTIHALVHEQIRARATPSACAYASLYRKAVSHSQPRVVGKLRTLSVADVKQLLLTLKWQEGKAFEQLGAAEQLNSWHSLNL